jgi:hypothetical protein
MVLKPYLVEPDVLKLVIDNSLIGKLSLKGIDSAWGESEEQFCSYRGVLVGMLLGKAAEAQRYYEGLKVPYKDRSVILLFPKIRKYAVGNLPEVPDFINALRELLEQLSCYTVICEADCDQNDIDRTLGIDEALAQLEGYLSGQLLGCPTFIVQTEI